MADVMAIVSKAVFEKQAPGAGVGVVLPLDQYVSTHKALEPLAEGGALFLVTVRPPDEALWLVAVLEAPQRRADGWHAKPNRAPIRDLSALKAKLTFANGKGLAAKPGALGMSLQTPRALTPADAALLRGGVATSAPAATTAGGATRSKTAKTKAAATEGSPRPPRPEKAAAPPDGAEAAVEEALRARDGAAALLAALAWWRATRAPAVADLVDTISDRVTAAPIVDRDEWNRTATRRDSLELGRLLPELPNLPASYLPTAAELLEAFPDDPRISRAVATWAQDPPTTSSSTFPFWTRMLGVVARTGDSRAVRPLRKRLAATPPPSKDAWKKGPSQFWGKFYGAIERTLSKLDGSAAQVVSAELAPLAQLAKQLTPRAPATVEPITAPAAATVVAGPPLERARQHLAAGHVAPAIKAMLEAWRAWRAPELADAIDLATRLLPSYDRPLGTTDGAVSDAWDEAFASTPVASLPQLLASLPVGGPKQAELRLARLTTLEDDPRIALRLAELSATTSIASPERTHFWRALFELIARIRDLRTCAPLVAQFDRFTGTYYDHHRQARRIVGPFALDPVAALGGVPKVPGTSRATFDALVADLEKLDAARPERALCRAIAKDGDAGWSIYADWLQERSHPRGEAITLELAAARGGSTKGTERRLAELRSTPYLNGPFDDLTGRVGQWKRAPLVATARELAVDTWAGTLTWRALVGYAPLAVIQRIRFDATVLQRPTAEDFGRVLADATALTEVSHVPVAARVGRSSGDPIPPLADELGAAAKSRGFRRASRDDRAVFVR
jgi:uncharacterized protein (TIGR02996 family)